MYSKQISLISKQNQEILSQKSVLIVGSGGLGNSLALILSCVGLKEIIVVDFDEIEISNIPRQLTFKENQIGQKKASTLAENIKRCKDTSIKYFDKKLQDIDISNINIDLILDASDNFEVRKYIDSLSKKTNIPWIYASVEGWMGQVCFFEKGDFSIFNTSSHKAKGVMPSLVSLIASVEANIAIRYLSNLKVKRDILYYISFEEELEIKKFKI